MMKSHKSTFLVNTLTWWAYYFPVTNDQTKLTTLTQEFCLKFEISFTARGTGFV